MSYSSTSNTVVGYTMDTSFSGTYDDTSGYTVVRLWCTTPANNNLTLFFADTSATLDTDAETEVYPIYRNHASAITSLVKKRYAKVSLTATDLNSPPQERVTLRTKFASRTPHPFLSYMTDDITANVTVALDELTVNQSIDHSFSNILIYGSSGIGSDSLYHRPIHTDDNGNSVIVGEDFGTGRAPILIGGVTRDALGQDTSDPPSTIWTESDGRVVISTGVQDGSSNYGNGVYPIGGITPDNKVSLLKVTDVNHLLVAQTLNGLEVSSENPLPVDVSMHYLKDSVTSVVNINGAPISQLNPMLNYTRDSVKSVMYLGDNSTLVSNTSPLPVKIVYPTYNNYSEIYTAESVAPAQILIGFSALMSVNLFALPGDSNNIAVLFYIGSSLTPLARYVIAPLMQREIIYPAGLRGVGVNTNLNLSVFDALTNAQVSNKININLTYV